MSLNGGYTNGYKDHGSNRLYDSERGRDRRAGGYGEIDNPRLGRPGDLERRKANRQSRSRSRRRNGAGREIEDVVDYIKQEWPFMTEDECIPVQVALQLLDDSSLGLASRSDEFHETQDRLQKALKAVVNEHHQGFNSSIGTFHQLQASIQTSQKRVRVLKESLSNARNNLSATKPELKDLYVSVQEHEVMLEVLNTIEELKQLPAKLESTISDKRFLSAVDLLQDALRLARRSDLEGLGALTDLKIFLSNQDHTLTDILIEELHNHLYLKSPYCEDRWKIYARGVDLEVGTAPREMVVFLDSLNLSEPKTENTSRSAEAETFDYIHLTLEALNKLGRLDVAIDAIEQRMPVELYRVIEKSIQEVEQHHSAKTLVLNDLLRTIYARFEAIAEGHRVLHDIASGIAKRDKWDVPKLTRGFKELWKLYQSEIRSLLHDYLSNSATGQAQSVDRNVFRYKREKTRLFKLDWTDSPKLQTETEDLMFIFKSFVPGLVSLPTDKPSNDNSVGHRLLVEPSVFNMGILLPPSIAFLRRLKDIVPAGSEIVISTLSSFLNDFLINVFHPQLEETLSEHCMIELDAFQADATWARHAQRPIFKGTTKFFSTITTFCKMLDNLTHDQLFSHLVVSQLNIYHEKCLAWYTDVVRSRDETYKAAAAFADSGDIRDIVVGIREGQDLYDKETALLVDANLDEANLFKSMSALCLLYSSMMWLSMKLKQLRYISGRAFDSSAGHDKPQIKRSLTGLLPGHAKDETRPVYLPLNNETAGIFDGVIQGYQELAATALRTLHLEFRCHMIRHVRKSFTTSYQLPMQVEDPDPAVVSLVSDLVAINEELRAHLLEADHSFVVNGSSNLLDSLMIRTTRQIKTMNLHGCQRMQLNILVLRQNLLNIDRETSLIRSSTYFDLFQKGPDAILSAAKPNGVAKQLAFGEEELKTLLELWYSGVKNSTGDEVKVRRELSDHLLQLSEAMWNT